MSNMKAVLFGDGYWSNNIKRTLKLYFDDIEIAYIVDPVMKEDTPNITYLKNINEFNNHILDVDLAIVCSPTITHFEIVEYLLKNKIPTLVEKPITNNLSKAEYLFSIAEKNNVVLMVDHVYLHNSSIKVIEEIIKSGDLGNIIHISFYRTNLGPIRTDVSALWDLTTHDISILNTFVNKKYKKITASGLTRNNNELQDMINVSIEYENLFVTLFSSWLHPSKERIIKIVGDKKMLIFDEINTSEKIKIYDKKIDSINELNFLKNGSYFSFAVGDIVSPFIPETDSLKNVLEVFLKNIKNNKFLEEAKNETLGILKILDEIESVIN